MKTDETPIAIAAENVPPRKKSSLYPEPFSSRVAGREKRQLGDFFGLRNFGVNMTRLAPNAQSALRHAHSRQDEFIYVLLGRPTMYSDRGKATLTPGQCAGFPAGTGNACHLVNETDEDVVYLEIGDRTPGDEVVYPDDDIEARFIEGVWHFFHKDGSPYS
jgi:uncharacterized cupin superfamily protein